MSSDVTLLQVEDAPFEPELEVLIDILADVLVDEWQKRNVVACEAA